MYFSPQGEKIPKELLRLRLKLPCFCWKARTHGSKGVAVLAELAQATSINREAIYTLLKRSAKINCITMQCSALQGNAVRRDLCRWEACARRRKARAV